MTQNHTLSGKKILLILGGGIAVYKCLDLIRRLRERGADVRCIMTKASQEFITPLSVGALSANKVFTELFDREDEQDVGHIRLARDADLIVVTPATADFMAKMAQGHANDLASTVLLAASSPVLIAPAMNPSMWNHKATQRNIKTLQSDGIHFIGPMAGEMAEFGEAGKGRMAEPLDIVAEVEMLMDDHPKPLKGLRAIVTSGPTHEPIDPVRFIANRSSGKQGHAVAQFLARAGADVTLISGPVNIEDPTGCAVIKVKTAQEMYDVALQLLPADIAVMVAAVADWRVESRSEEKIKKANGANLPQLQMAENPDILKTIGHHEQRPEIVVGFAAETTDLIKHAETKLQSKGADFIVANDVSPETGTFGGDKNKVTLISQNSATAWPQMSKNEVASALVQQIVDTIASRTA